MNSSGKVRPGFSVNCQLSRAGQQSPGGWCRKREGSSRLGVESGASPLMPGNSRYLCWEHSGPRGLRGWVGFERTPKEMLARAWVQGEAGAAEHARRLCRGSCPPLSQGVCRDYNSRSASLRPAPPRHAPPLAPSPPPPPASSSRPTAARAGGAERGGEGSEAGDPGDSGAVVSPHPEASDPTGHSTGTPTAPPESPTPTPPLFGLLSLPSCLYPPHPSLGCGPPPSPHSPTSPSRRPSSLEMR